MDQVLPPLLAFPPHPPPVTPLPDSEYDKQIKSLVQHLNVLSANKLTAVVPGEGNLLDILDPSINTLPYLYALLAHIAGLPAKQKAGWTSDAFAPGGKLWQKMSVFMERFDGRQIRYAGTELRRLISMTADKARRTSQVRSNGEAQGEATALANIAQPVAAVAPIGSALLRVDPSSSTFTSSHLVFARLCLETRAYHDALPVIDLNIYHFPPTTNKAAENSMFPYLCSNHESSCTYLTLDSGLSGKLDYRDHLRYYLFSAMIYMAMKKWKHALLFLEIVMMTPVANNASKMQVEAYKKWVLVSLLHKGHTLQLPTTTNVQAAKQYRALSKAYDGLAEVFMDGIKGEESNQRLIAEAQVGQRWWATDQNTGLVAQVIAAYRQFSVLELGKTFAALTVSDITRRTSPDPNDYAETGQFMIHLISSGHLKATVSQPSDDPAGWIVRFSDSSTSPLADAEDRQYEALVRHTQNIKYINENIREIDRKLSLSKDYLAEVKKGKKNKNGDGGIDEGGSWMNHGDLFDQDEDMMGDM